MQQSRKIKWWVYAVVLFILIVMGYYSYTNSERLRREGVFTIGQINSMRLARNGWKIFFTYSFAGKIYNSDGIYSFDYYSKDDLANRYFVILRTETPDKASLIPTFQVPDSITSAPIHGWGQRWMKEHFPEVVKYVDDTR